VVVPRRAAHLLVAAVALALILAATPPASGAPPPARTEDDAVAALLADPRVASWVERYPPGPTTDATFDDVTHRWTVHVRSGAAGEIATGEVDDASGRVVEAWTGPQVAWKMARGAEGAFGGRVLTSMPVWLALCAVFLVGLADLRRPLALRNLDLLALVSFTVSWWFFERGEVFRSAPLALVPLAYLLARMLWIAMRHRPLRPARPVLPVWLLAAAAVFLGGFRLGLDIADPPPVIDVGYAGVVGADRILHGRTPYGNMPVRAGRPRCDDAAPTDARERIQSNGRCESAVERGDTYGPVTYLSYVPAVAAFGWSGRWDRLPAARWTALAFDLLTIAGLIVAGLRHGGRTLATTLAFGWIAFPFTSYVLLAAANDALVSATLVWGFVAASSAWGRGALASLAGATKFAPLLVAPLWLTYPERSVRDAWRFAAAFAVVALASLMVALLDAGLVDGLRAFFDRTLGFQLGRDSPFSVWGWGQYHAAGIPDLHVVQRFLQGAVIGLALVVALVPRRKGPLELAALTAAVLIALQLVLTHWFYLYLPWLLPFVLLAVLLGRGDAARA
jgi:hypothetical protein